MENVIHNHNFLAAITHESYHISWVRAPKMFLDTAIECWYNEMLNAVLGNNSDANVKSECG